MHKSHPGKITFVIIVYESGKFMTDEPLDAETHPRSQHPLVLHSMEDDMDHFISWGAMVSGSSKGFLFSEKDTSKFCTGLSGLSSFPHRK